MTSAFLNFYGTLSIGKIGFNRIIIDLLVNKICFSYETSETRKVLQEFFKHHDHKDLINQVSLNNLFMPFFWLIEFVFNFRFPILLPIKRRN